MTPAQERIERLNDCIGDMEHTLIQLKKEVKELERIESEELAIVREA